MKKNIFKGIFLIIILTIIFILTIGIDSYALSTEMYKSIYSTGIDGKISTVGNEMLGVVQTAGTGIAVIMLVVNAIRFMVAAPEQKAQIKGQLIVFTIGAVLLFAGTNIFAMIARQAKNM